jgi:hypothetical protein
MSIEGITDVYTNNIFDNLTNTNTEFFYSVNILTINFYKVMKHELI